MIGRKFTFETRASGLLLHPTSLPSRHGVGDLGREAHRFADFLAAGGQRWWQMLPVGPPGRAPGYSPYSSESAFAGSPWLVSLDRLVEDGLLGRADVKAAGGLYGKYVDYAAAIRYREPRLRKAFAAFVRRGPGGDDFNAFCRGNAVWLDDYALFAALKKAYRGKGWHEWDRGVRLRVPSSLEKAREELAEEVLYHMFVQYRFARQWRELREHCHTRDVGLIGDIPIFVAYDSADVWAHRELFLLDRHGRPTVVSGAPPDAFTADGQKWNHPHYNWDAHRAEGYAWWAERFAAMARQFDGVRIDHFLGFHRAWAVPAAAKTARRGKWLPGPGEEFFRAIRKRVGRFPIIAEDLGVVTPEAVALRDKFGFPGMRILQAGFGEGGQYHLPYNYVRRCVAYTGTHDNATAIGWFRSLKDGERRRAIAYLGREGGAFHWNMIRAVTTSVANTAIFPVQDVLGLGDDARMNVPGVDRGNWRWRMKEGQLSRGLADELRRLTEVSGRV